MDAPFLPVSAFFLDDVYVFHLRQPLLLPHALHRPQVVPHILPRLLVVRRRPPVGQRHIQVIPSEIGVHEQRQPPPCPLPVVPGLPLTAHGLSCCFRLGPVAPAQDGIHRQYQRVPGPLRLGAVVHAAHPLPVGIAAIQPLFHLRQLSHAEKLRVFPGHALPHGILCASSRSRGQAPGAEPPPVQGNSSVRFVTTSYKPFLRPPRRRKKGLYYM